MTVFEWTILIMSPIWLYLIFRLVSSACFKSWWEAKRQSKQEEQDDAKEE